MRNRLPSVLAHIPAWAFRNGCDWLTVGNSGSATGVYGKGACMESMHAWGKNASGSMHPTGMLACLSKLLLNYCS